MAVSAALDAKPVFQSRPSGTSATVVVSSKAFTLLTLVVCNTSAAAATFRIFHDIQGNTYDESTALFWDVSVASDTTKLIEGRFFVNQSGTLAVRTSVASALTFTGYAAKI